MFETFKAIKDDPRSSTGVFRALKRNTSHGSDGYCVYTFHNFGIAAEAEFTTVHEDDVRNEAFEVCAGDGSRLDYHPLWGGLYYLEEIVDDGPWEVPAQYLYEPRLDTGSFILSQTGEGVDVWRPIEQEKEEVMLRRLLSLGGTISIYSEYVFCDWLMKISENARNIIRDAPREICEETSYWPRYLKIMVSDPREVMFGKRGEDDKGWVSNIQRVG